jgi:hypothetical protein
VLERSHDDAIPRALTKVKEGLPAFCAALSEATKAPTVADDLSQAAKQCLPLVPDRRQTLPVHVSG